MIELTIRNRYGFDVITQHETQHSADIQRRLYAGETINIKPVAIKMTPIACEQRRKPKQRRTK